MAQTVTQQIIMVELKPYESKFIIQQLIMLELIETVEPAVGVIFGPRIQSV